MLSFESALLVACESTHCPPFRLGQAGLKDLGCTCLHQRILWMFDVWHIEKDFLLLSFTLPHTSVSLFTLLTLFVPTTSAWQLLNCWGPLSLLQSSSSCCWIMWQPHPLPPTPGPPSWCWLQCWVAAPNLSLNHISNRSPTHWPSLMSARNINRSAEGSFNLFFLIHLRMK